MGTFEVRYYAKDLSNSTEFINKSFNIEYFFSFKIFDESFNHEYFVLFNNDIKHLSIKTNTYYSIKFLGQLVNILYIEKKAEDKSLELKLINDEHKEKGVRKLNILEEQAFLNELYYKNI